ncbi:hypothetical protein ACJRO7_006677 [Eucalyptus globulus]|uniref:Uncharacterized protein n=1 Tax=Eucalyptus globulus TaxID=34317 RepID=A0ABD3IK46_EUCGL
MDDSKGTGSHVGGRGLIPPCRARQTLCFREAMSGASSSLSAPQPRSIEHRRGASRSIRAGRVPLESALSGLTREGVPGCMGTGCTPVHMQTESEDAAMLQYAGFGFSWHSFLVIPFSLSNFGSES